MVAKPSIYLRQKQIEEILKIQRALYTIYECFYLDKNDFPANIDLWWDNMSRRVKIISITAL